MKQIEDKLDKDSNLYEALVMFAACIVINVSGTFNND